MLVLMDPSIPASASSLKSALLLLPVSPFMNFRSCKGYLGLQYWLGCTWLCIGVDFVLSRISSGWLLCGATRACFMQNLHWSLRV